MSQSPFKVWITEIWRKTLTFGLLRLICCSCRTVPVLSDSQASARVGLTWYFTWKTSPFTKVRLFPLYVEAPLQEDWAVFMTVVNREAEALPSCYYSACSFSQRWQLEAEGTMGRHLPIKPAQTEIQSMERVGSGQEDSYESRPQLNYCSAMIIVMVLPHLFCFIKLEKIMENRRLEKINI